MRSSTNEWVRLQLEFTRPAMTTTPYPQLIFHPERYVLQSVLGRGGYGQVWRAQETRTGRTVALKLLLQHQLENQLGVDQFEREIRAAASFDHPFIVPILDTGHDLSKGMA